MQIDSEKTWPISTHETNASALMGIPQRLGDGQCLRRETYDSSFPLEAAEVEAVRLVAASWGLSVIPGPVEYAWPTTTDSLTDRSPARSRTEAE